MLLLLSLLKSVYPCITHADHREDKKIVKVVFRVASGTYIRTLREELGVMLGVPATLTELRRTKVGEYNVENAEKV